MVAFIKHVEQERKTRSRRAFSPVSEINVTPMVDVMLVLLVIFIVTAPLLTTGVNVKLPQVAHAKSLPQDNKALTLYVEKDGTITLNDAKVDADELRARLTAIRRIQSGSADLRQRRPGRGLRPDDAGDGVGHRRRHHPGRLRHATAAHLAADASINNRVGQYCRKGLADPKVTPIRRDNTAIGFILSIAFHAAVIGAFWISWPYVHHDTPIQPPLIVDLVPIDEMTTAPPKAAPKTEEPAPEPAPQPEPPKPDTTPPPAPDSPPCRRLSRSTPPPPKPKPDITPPPVTPPPPPKPEPPKPKKKDDMASLEKLLKDMQKKAPKPQAASPANADPRHQTTNNQAPSISDRATMTELDAIRRHIEGCWRIDPGKEGIENMSAEIRVFINPDGIVFSARNSST